jgi:hypothetical protein
MPLLWDEMTLRMSCDHFNYWHGVFLKYLNEFKLTFEH